MAFLDDRLAEIDLWQQKLSENERSIIRACILELAEGNPREVKRLLNSAVMAGFGALLAREHRV